MKQQPFGITCLLLGTLLVGGLSACTAPPSSQADTGQGNTMASSESNPPSAAERAQRRQALRKQIEAVLTPSQVQQLHTKLNQGEKFRAAIRELNLPADQKAKIQDILKTAYGHRAKQNQSN